MAITTKLPLVINCEQGSPEWLAARAGRVTASHICDVINFKKNGEESTSRRDYRIKMVTEMLTGTPCEDVYPNADMRRGTELEPYARIAYEDLSGMHVQQVGLFVHASIPQAAASPDGLVGADGLIEIKCPRSYNHINNILADGIIDSDYQLQMLWQMECTQRRWCDFVSYDPLMPEALRLFVVRFNRDEEALAGIREKVVKFIEEANNLKEILLRKGSA